MFGYCTATGAGDWLLMIGLWGAFLGLVVWLTTRIFPSARSVDAVELLDERLAAGQIDPGMYHPPDQAGADRLEPALRRRR